MLVAACFITPSKADDGASCQSASDCKSGGCNDGTCGGSKCSCPGQCPSQGAASSDCATGWVCVYAAPDPVTGFFGASGSNSCAPTCGSCPPHWLCHPGSTLCAYDSAWRSPQVTIAGPTTGAAGETLSFHAQATSPIGAKIIDYEWSFGGPDAVAVHGADATHVYPSSGQYTVALHVTDDGSVTAHFPNGDATAQVTICAPAGHACGGTDCCDGKTCRYVADAGSPTGMTCE